MNLLPESGDSMLKSSMSSVRKVLVTGGSGLVGRYVVDELCRHHEVSVVDLRRPHRSDLAFHQADLLQESELDQLFAGVDVVVHLAGIPHPLNHPPETVFRVNVQGTYNVLECCARMKVSKVIFMSSESTLGFAFSTTRLWPEHLPVDESHPTRPQDPYGLSKLACELLCAGFSRRVGMRTLCLRAPWIWVPEKAELVRYRSLVTEYRKWFKNLWAFVHVSDVTRAIALGIANDTPKLHDVFFICADENWTGIESRALASEFYPETQSIDPTFVAKASFISTAKARKVLRFQATCGVRDILS